MWVAVEDHAFFCRVWTLDLGNLIGLIRSADAALTEVAVVTAPGTIRYDESL